MTILTWIQHLAKAGWSMKAIQNLKRYRAMIESQDERIKALEAENAKLRRAIGQPSGSGRVVVSPLAHLSQEEQDAASNRHAASLLEGKP